MSIPRNPNKDVRTRRHGAALPIRGAMALAIVLATAACIPGERAVQLEHVLPPDASAGSGGTLSVPTEPSPEGVAEDWAYDVPESDRTESPIETYPYSSPTGDRFGLPDDPDPSEGIITGAGIRPLSGTISPPGPEDAADPEDETFSPISAIAFRDERIIGSDPGGLLLLSNSDRERQMEVCDAFFSLIPYSEGRPETEEWDEVPTYWPDVRVGQPRPKQAGPGDCAELIKNYDWARAAGHLATLGRLDVRGPVFMGFSRKHDRTFYIDASRFGDDSIGRAVLIWRDRISHDPRLWDQGLTYRMLSEHAREIFQQYGEVIVALFPSLVAKR